MTFIKSLPAAERVPMRLSRLAFQKGHSSVRKMLNQGCEENLTNFAVLYPGLARGFFNMVFRLGPGVRTITFPSVLLNKNNHAVVERITRDQKFAGSLVSENGVLDLRKAGLKHKPNYIDLTPHYKQKTLEDYREILKASSRSFANDAELGNLYLFKCLLRARIDLYIAGERRSVLKKQGEDIGLTDEMTRIQGFLDYLIKAFPFGRINERGYLKEKIEVASMLLSRKNNTAAYAAMVPLTERLERVLAWQLSERMVQARNSRKWKIQYENGTWLITQRGYRMTDTGLLKKEVIEKKAPTSKLLSMLQHEEDNISREIKQNVQTLAELEFIRHHLPDYWDNLYEICLDFSGYFDPHKVKAGVELEGALRLVAIGSVQAINIADSLISLAQKDIEARQEDLQRQKERMFVLKSEAEVRMGQYLWRFSISLARELAAPALLSDEEAINRIDRRLGGILGTFFNGEMREEWLGKAKSRVVGLKKALPKLTTALQNKKRAEAEGNLDAIKAINMDITQKAEAGARFILGIISFIKDARRS